jgi:hypothetical protein
MAVEYPGMNPHLEGPRFWPGFHHLFADEIVAFLNARLGPNYYADVEVRTLLEEVGIATTAEVVYADAAILETDQVSHSPTAGLVVAPAPILRPAVVPDRDKLRSVQVFVVEPHTLVTTIELLSPANKRGTGLQAYREKRLRLLQSEVNLIEIDLLRGGERPGWELKQPPLDTDYVLLVNRTNEYEQRTSEIWPLALNEAFPVLPVPLRFPDNDIALDLTAIFRSVYERGAYARRITPNTALPAPELRPAMAIWLAAIDRA